MKWCEGVSNAILKIFKTTECVVLKILSTVLATSGDFVAYRPTRSLGAQTCILCAVRGRGELPCAPPRKNLYPVTLPLAADGILAMQPIGRGVDGRKGFFWWKSQKTLRKREARAPGVWNGREAVLKLRARRTLAQRLNSLSQSANTLLLMLGVRKGNRPSCSQSSRPGSSRRGEKHSQSTPGWSFPRLLVELPALGRAEQGELEFRRRRKDS